MYNYKSPIETTKLQVKSDIEKRLEDTTYKAVIECGVAVDKDELIKALAYDRGQYEKGYGEGYRAAKDEIVLCKDCDCWCEDMKTGRQEFGNVTAPCEVWIHSEFGYTRYTAPDDFCSYGERKDS